MILMTNLYCLTRFITVVQQVISRTVCSVQLWSYGVSIIWYDISKLYGSGTVEITGIRDDNQRVREEKAHCFTHALRVDTH
jgi:hypothetical protein